jgi:hypothetical protein
MTTTPQREKLIHLIQERPPPGGYPPLPIERRFERSNWYRGLVIFGIFIGLMHYGMYKAVQSARKKRFVPHLFL